MARRTQSVGIVGKLAKGTIGTLGLKKGPAVPMPPPPKRNREMTKDDLPPPPAAPPTVGDLVLECEVEGHGLTDDETRYILEQYLKPSQRKDVKLIKFIMSYLNNRSTSQAAKEAGLTYSQGYNLRCKVEVHNVIEAITQKAVMKYGYDAAEVIERVKEIAALDPVEFENPDGSYKTHLSQIAPEARRAIKKFKAKNIWGEDVNGMKTVVGQLIEVELWDKMKSIELLGREKNIFKETRKIEHDVTTNMKDVLLASKARAEERIEASKPDLLIEARRIYEPESKRESGNTSDESVVVVGTDGPGSE